MALSARNHLPGTVESVEKEGLMARVVIRVGDNHVESVITRQSADELNLRVGDTVTAVIKATEVMVSK
jgi:molybdate transport system regulatory protein